MVDAQIITKVACRMIVKYQDDAARHADLRAMELHREPRAAARWYLVAHMIGTLFDCGLDRANDRAREILSMTEGSR